MLFQNLIHALVPVFKYICDNYRYTHRPLHETNLIIITSYTHTIKVVNDSVSSSPHLMLQYVMLSHLTSKLPCYIYHVALTIYRCAITYKVWYKFQWNVVQFLIGMQIIILQFPLECR